MKRKRYLLIALLLIGCSEPREKPAGGKPVAFASIPPQAGLLKRIAGDRMEVRTLVDPGQSPHAYEPTARQLSALGESDALFTIGMQFERQLVKKIAPLYPNLAVVESAAGIELRTMPHAHHGEDCDHGHGNTDPHVWLAPRQAKELAQNMARALEGIDPENAATYRANALELAVELDALDAQIGAQLAPFKGGRFYVFHPSFGYFADAYGLVQIPIELDGKSPSPRQLAQLIEQAKADGVKVVFVQKQFPSDSAQAVADAIGGRVVPLDPLAEELLANLREIADALAMAMGK